MSGANLVSVLSAIKAVVISRPEGILESQLDGDFQGLMGMKIPWKDLGFSSLSALISSEPSLTTVRKGGGSYVVAEESKSSHLASLVAHQKKQAPKKKRSSAIHNLFNSQSHYSKYPGRQSGRSIGHSTQGRKGFSAGRGSASVRGRVTSGSKPQTQFDVSHIPPLINSSLIGAKPAGMESFSDSNSFSNVSSVSKVSHRRPLPKEPDPPISNVAKSKDSVPSLPQKPISKQSKAEEVVKNKPIKSNKEPSQRRLVTVIDSLPEKQKSSRATVKRRDPPPAAEPEVSLDKLFLVPQIPAPVPADPEMESSVPATNGGSFLKKSKGRRPPYQLHSEVDVLVDDEMPFTNAFLALVKSLKWPEPEYLLLPRIASNNTELFTSTASVSCLLPNSNGFISYDFSTFPDEYLNRKDSKEAVSKKALEEIKIRFEEAKKSAPVSNDVKLVVNRVVSLVLPHTNGLWDFKVKQLYTEQYGETLPSNWIEVCTLSKALIAEKLVDFTYCIKVADSGSDSPPKANLDAIMLGDLELPESSTWDVFITKVVSPSLVWFRFVGPEYSGWYDEVLEAMCDHYSNWASLVAKSIEVGRIYAYPTADIVARVEVLSVDPNDSSMVTVRHIDHGDVEVVPASHLCILDLNFRDLPPQALPARLSGLENYSFSEEATSLLVDRIWGQVLVAEPVAEEVQASSNGSDKSLFDLILHDTSGSEQVNINKCICELLQMGIWNEPALCEVDSICKMVITSIWKTGDIFCRMLSKNFKWLTDELSLLPISDLRVMSAEDLCVDKIYIIRDDDTDEVKRVQIMTSVPFNNQVDICFIDSGEISTAFLTDLVPLENLSAALCRIPRQAIKVQLSQKTNCDPNLIVEKLGRMIPKGSEVFVKVVSQATATEPASVEIFQHNQLDEIVSINATLFYSKSINCLLNKENTIGASASSPTTDSDDEKAAQHLITSISNDGTKAGNPVVIKPAQTPGVNEEFDIFVVAVSNPSNFTVIPFKFLNKLRSLQDNMTIFYSQLDPNNPDYIIKEFKVGQSCAIDHVDGVWYRATVQQVIIQRCIKQLVLRFCDFGNIDMVSFDRPKLLHPKFNILPGLGFKAKLAGIMPKHSDWDVSDCRRLSDLMLEKTFCSIVRGTEVEKDCSTMLLQVFDTSDESVDIDLAQLMIKEDRAHSICS